MKAQECCDSFLALSTAPAAPLLGFSVVKPAVVPLVEEVKTKEQCPGKGSSQRGVPMTKLPFVPLRGEARGG